MLQIFRIFTSVYFLYYLTEGNLLYSNSSIYSNWRTYIVACSFTRVCIEDFSHEREKRFWPCEKAIKTQAAVLILRLQVIPPQAHNIFKRIFPRETFRARLYLYHIIFAIWLGAATKILDRISYVPSVFIMWKNNNIHKRNCKLNIIWIILEIEIKQQLYWYNFWRIVVLSNLILQLQAGANQIRSTWVSNKAIRQHPDLFVLRCESLEYVCTYVKLLAECRSAPTIQFP